MSNTKVLAFTPPPRTQPFAVPTLAINVSHQRLYSNIRRNIRRPVPQFTAAGEKPDHIALIGGGWSLDDTLDELRRLYHDDGVKLVALNGAGKWLMARNLRPWAQIVLEARPDPNNLDFVREPIPHCRYLLASQCAPGIFDLCEGRNVAIYHAIADGNDTKKRILDEYYNGRWNAVPSAGTVGIVAIMLMRLAGYRFQHLFGVDSCYRDDGRHHAYAQPINEGETTGLFWCAGRSFRCSGWQAKQAYTFRDVVRAHGQHIRLQVHGDGLLAHMLRTGAELKEAG